MKRAVFLFVGVILATGCLAGDLPKTKDDFLTAVRKAYEEQDVKRVHELTWEQGMSAFDHNQQQQMLDMMVYNGGVDSIVFQPLPPDFMDIPVAWGRRIEPTHAADGIITVNLKPSDKNSNSAVSMPYALINGAYYLVTSKTTDLGWKGPQDQPVTVAVAGPGQEKVKIHVQYNASGVDLERDQISPSNSFPAQYLTLVTVTSDTDDASVTLRLLDGKGNAFYESKPLKGKGRLQYHKGDTTPQ